MRPETFFEKFDLIADAPDAVARVRKVILHLAVSGRLEGSLSEHHQHWLRVPLGKTGTWRGGGTPSKSRVDFWDGDLPWVSPKDMKTLRIADAQDHISKTALEDSAVRLIPPRSILMVVRGMILARAFPVALTGREVTVNQDMKALTPHEDASAEFLLLALRALESNVLGQIERSSHGTCKLRTEVLETLLVPLPPLAEQKRIVAKVEELMAWCDRLEAQQAERAERHAKLARAALARFAEAPTSANLAWLFHDHFTIPPADLRKAILTLAVQGKLVRTAQEPSIAELGSILSEASVNGVSKGPTHDASATEILRISAGTSRVDFHVDEYDFKHVDLTSEEVEKFRLLPGDLLACRFNGNLHYVGRFSYYRGVSGRVQVNPDKLIRFRINSAHDPRYVCLAMNAEPTRGAIEAMCATTAGNIGLSAGKLKTVTIPLPPLAEQRRIVAKVDALMALVDELETREAAARRTATALLDALVAELTSSPESPRTETEPLAAEDPAPYDAPGDVIDLHSSSEFIRTVLAAEIADRLRGDRYFGQVKLQKILYLAEYHCQVPEIDSSPIRDAAGPHDRKLIAQVEAKLLELDWFEEGPRADGKGHRYEPRARAGEQSAYFEKLWPVKAAAIRRLVDQMKDWKTERCERLATLYAAWNDLLLWGEPASDERILCEVLENWNPAKLRIPKASWLEMLQWMKREGYVPTGWGRPTVAAPQAELF
jgi:type I restriction enzyme S subunit